MLSFTCKVRTDPPLPPLTGWGVLVKYRDKQKKMPPNRIPSFTFPSSTFHIILLPVNTTRPISICGPFPLSQKGDSDLGRKETDFRPGEEKVKEKKIPFDKGGKEPERNKAAALPVLPVRHQRPHSAPFLEGNQLLDSAPSSVSEMLLGPYTTAKPPLPSFLPPSALPELTRPPDIRQAETPKFHC